VELVVKGHIPRYAAGTLYRTGPAQHIVKDTPKGDFKLSHWFDGFSKVHRFELIPSPDGSMKVSYNSRSNVDTLLEKIRATGNYDQISFGQKRDPCDGLFKKFKTFFQIPRDGSPGEHNIGVVIAPDVPGMDDGKSDGKSRFKTLTVFTDSTGFKSLDPDTLEPLGVANQRSLHPSLTGPFSAAHANVDPLTGDVINHNLDFTFPCTYRVWKTSRAIEETEILATIKGPDIKPAYIHASFISANFAILALWSAHIAAGGLSVLWQRNVLDAIKPFDASGHVLWLVVDRQHGRGLVAKFTSPAAFMFHSANAWEETNADGSTDVVCDLVEYANLDVIHRFYYENLMSSSAKAPAFVSDHQTGINPRFRRYRLRNIPTTNTPAAIPTRAAEVVKTIDGPLVGEFPTINPRFSTKPSRYLYTAVDQGRSSFFDGVAKTDLETGEVVYWMAEHHTPGEPIFVADPEGTAEDAGVLLVVVLDGDRGTSYLLVLDARDLSEVGRAEVEGVVAFGFHGRHIGR